MVGGHNVLFIMECCPQPGGGGGPAVLPEIVDHEIWNSTGGETTFVVPLPTYDAGDVVYIFFIQDSSTGTLSIDGDWDPKYQTIVPTTAKIAVWTKTMVGDEGATVTVSSTLTERAAALTMTVTDHGAAGPLATNANGLGTTATVNALTTETDNNLGIAAVFTDGSTTPLGEMTNLTKLNESTLISGGTIGVYYEECLTADEYPADSASMFASDEWLTIRFSIEEA